MQLHNEIFETRSRIESETIDRYRLTDDDDDCGVAKTMDCPCKCVVQFVVFAYRTKPISIDTEFVRIVWSEMVKPVWAHKPQAKEQ